MGLRSGQAATTVGFDLCPQRVFYLGATLIGVSAKEQVFPLVAPCVCHCGVQKAEVPEGHTGSVKPEHCPCQILWSIEGSAEGPIPFRPSRPQGRADDKPLWVSGLHYEGQLLAWDGAKAAT